MYTDYNAIFTLLLNKDLIFIWNLSIGLNLERVLCLSILELGKNNSNRFAGILWFAHAPYVEFSARDKTRKLADVTHAPSRSQNNFVLGT